jgi:hypothetical protein
MDGLWTIGGLATGRHSGGGRDRRPALAMAGSKRPAVGRLVAVLALGAAGLLGGCGSLGGMPEVDRVYLAAAGTWDRNKDGIVTCD